ncbi:MAG: hypothetical protein HZA31_08410 [Opitutae bacterium]|nr:hypothetical protein [Opitutae bacterium]
MINPPLRYQILPLGSRYEITSPTGKNHFEAPASTDKLSKIYALVDGQTVLYVGMTGQPMANRLRGAFQAAGETGYYGYKWKALGHAIVLLIWILPDLFPRHEDREAVEAEVIFEIRNQLGYWPRWQNEMHFWNAQSTTRAIAQKIFGDIKTEVGGGTASP